MSLVEKRYGACNLCEAICGLEFTLTDGAITSVRGDADDPLSRGHICPKAVALQDVHADPDRLRRPMRRTGDEWQAISWDEAFDLVATRLAEVRATHGADAVAVYLGNPNVHSLGALTHGLPFVRALSTRNRFSATSVDQLPHHLVAWLLYGHQLLLPVPDLDRTRYLLVFGGNPMASNGSIMTAPDFPRRLRDLRERGGRMVVFDPRRTETAKVADEHHFVRPGTDAAVLLAMVRTVLDEGPARPASYVDGMDAVREAVGAFVPERVAAATGVPAEVIRRVAREFAGADGAACYGRLGVSAQRFGALCQWAVQLLNLVTGNLDRPGGTLFPRPAVDLVSAGLTGPGSRGRWRSRVRGLPEFGGELPVAVLAEEIATPGDGRVRALVTVAGNPVLSTPDGRRLDEALAGLDFMVAVDFYLNETTRHAHVVLPPTPALERDHYDLVFHSLAVRDTARWTPALFPPPADARHDWQIFAELTRRYRRRVGGGGPWRRRVRDAVLRRMSPARVVDLGLRTGPYRLSLRRLRRAPHGVDLGPLKPGLPGRLRTPDRRIDCAPDLLLADVGRAAADLLDAPGPGGGLSGGVRGALSDARSEAGPPGTERDDGGASGAGRPDGGPPGAAPAGGGLPGDGGLLLIGRRHVRSNNSWMHNYPRLVKGRPRHHLLMHPDDLAARDLADGDLVRVRSRVGAVEVAVEASDDLMPGVVSLPHGFGHARPGVRLSVAGQVAGVSANDLTDGELLDAVSGNAVLNGVPVSVERA